MSNTFPRREFACYLAAGVAGLSALPASGDDEATGDMPGLGSFSESELLLDLVRRVDADRLQREHLDQLRGDLELNLQRSKVLSAFALTNADEPAPVFAAWRSEG